MARQLPEGSGSGGRREGRLAARGALLKADERSDRCAPIQLGRYRVEEHLGAGGMGVVYAALDVERGERVALKTLHKMSAEGRSQLKNEFRSVADVIHPNLAVLHELVGEVDDLFFTMELVVGSTFLEHVRGAAREPAARAGPEMQGAAPTQPAPRPASSAGSDDPLDMPTAPMQAAPHRARRAKPLSEEGLDRLRRALPQLAEGLAALHAAGKLHRDIKPSNVMVTDSGRVVILDFGLVSDAHAGAEPDEILYGTPAYMAPELITLRPASPASDWYAVGVMLYEALVGELPHWNDLARLLNPDARVEVRPPRERVPDVPRDLDELCMALLARDPAARPSTAEVLARVGGSPLSRRPAAAREASTSGPSVVGRAPELAALEEAFAAVVRGDPTTVVLGGRAGMGKTTLCEAFVEKLARDHAAVILRGRCYERESLPFKAFDGIIDSLARLLQTLAPSELAPLLPDRVRDLARVFPVLLEIEPIASAPRDDDPPLDPNELRRRAFGALRELFVRLAARRRLVLYIDDLQWGDVDSARLFEDLVAPPKAPAALLLCAYRSEELDKSPFLSAILAPPRAASFGAALRRVDVGPLSLEGARELASARLTASGLDAARFTEEIARESEGSPFFLEQLVRHAASRRARAPLSDRGAAPELDEPPKSAVSLDKLVAARLALLAPEPRRLLEVIAIAAGPVELGVALAAAEIGVGAHRALSTLRAARFVRALGVGEGDTVESYHDRIRESVYSRLDPADRSARHASIAREIERRSPADAGRLAIHLFGAGERSRASPYAEIAAEEAFSALAFERAAELFRLSLDVDAGAASPERVASLQEKLGDALVAAGRGAEAAPFFLRAAERAGSDRSTALRSRAAQQLLSSGHFDEGRAVLRPLLEEVGVAWPETPTRALVSAVAGIARLELRGLSCSTPSGASIPPDVRATLDVCASAVKGVVAFDTGRAAGFLMRLTRLALDVGDAKRAAWGLAIYGAILITNGSMRGAKILDTIEASGLLTDDPYLRGHLATCRGIAEIGRTNFSRGSALVAAGLATLRDHCNDNAWETATATSALIEAKLSLGSYSELRAKVPEWRRRAERLGDVYAQVVARLACANIELADGDPKAARSSAEGATAMWWREAFTQQHWFAEKLQIRCDLYEGDVARAQQRVDAALRALRASNLVRESYPRFTAIYLRAAIALAAARGRRAPMVELSASRDVSTLARFGAPCTRGAADHIAGMLALRRGRDEEARSRFTSAASSFDAAKMALYAATMRRVLGVHAGGDGGLAQREAADAELRAEGIADPERWCLTLSPIV